MTAPWQENPTRPVPSGARRLPVSLERIRPAPHVLGGPNGPGYEDEWVRSVAVVRGLVRIRVELSLGGPALPGTPQRRTVHLAPPVLALLLGRRGRNKLQAAAISAN